MSEAVSNPSPVKRGKSWGRWYLFLVFLICYVWAYTYLGSIIVIENNTSRLGNLQSAHIESVYRAAGKDGGAGESGINQRMTKLFPYYTDGNAQPLWPWMMSPFAKDPPDLLFHRGKWFNLILSCTILVVLGILAARTFSFVGSAAIILMGGFGVILERSTFFSPDAIYYLLTVLTWLCGLSLIRQNRLWLYAVFGVFLGLAFLARPPVWPMVTSFVIVSVVRSLFELRRSKSGEERDSGWVNSNQLVGFAMLATSFLIVAGPRLSFANERFGDPLHWDQRYMIWADDLSDAQRFQRDYSDKDSLRALSYWQRPGPIQFVREHGVGALLERAKEGAIEQLRASVLGRRGWIIFYGFFVCAVVSVIHRLAMRHQNREVWRVRGTSARWMLLFTVLMIGITIGYAGIGNAIIPGNRITTGLFIPLLMTFIWIAERYRRQLQRSHYAVIVNRVYLGLMIFPILWISVRIADSIRVPM